MHSFHTNRHSKLLMRSERLCERNKEELYGKCTSLLILIFWNAIQRSIYLEHDVRIQRDKNEVRAPLKYWFHWFKFQFRWTTALHSHFAHIVSARSVSILILLFVHFVCHWRNRMECAVIILKWAITDAVVSFFPQKNMETLSLYRKRVWCKVRDRIWFEFQKKWQKNVKIAWDVSRVDHWYFNKPYVMLVFKND